MLFFFKNKNTIFWNEWGKKKQQKKNKPDVWTSEPEPYTQN